MPNDDPDAVSPTECPTCGEAFSTRQGLGQHHSHAHDESLTEYERRGNGGGVDCPTCDGTYKNRHGMRIHHEKVHGESLKEPPTDGSLTCPFNGCDRRFENRRGLGVHHKRVHGESIAGVEVECAWCGESATREPRELDFTERFFCNARCKGAHLSAGCSREELSIDELPKQEGECSVCGATVRRRPRYFKQVERTFCGPECLGQWRGEWITENRTGPDHPRWEGGTMPYGEGWNERKKERVRERDSRECQGCGLSESNHLERFNRRLCVHHITPARAFDDPGRRNAMNNLVALCQSCHKKAERVAPLYPFGKR